MRRLSARGVLILCGVALLATTAHSQGLLQKYEGKVTEHRLKNGWQFLLLQNHDAPVVSFFTHVDVGSSQEVYGITGLAHMFEHMAFKGTDKIGTKDYAKEIEAIAAVERAFLALKAERGKVGGGAAAQVAALETAWKDAQAKASEFIVENAFGEVIEREGGVGLNAFTSNDQTGYFFSLPANKIELWAYLESERFLKPVFRDFYKERDVVKEERRMRTESAPVGRLIEEFVATAFKAHPYGHPVVGHMSDLDSFTITDAEAFYKMHYVPANMVTTIAGDFNPADVIPLLEAYFGRIPAGDAIEPLRTVEPPQNAERRVAMVDQSQPFYIEGYHVPPQVHKDNAPLNALAEVLGQGRTSRLYRDLVRDKKMAAVCQAIRNFPGDKYPTMFVVLTVPTPGHTAQELGDEVKKQIAKVRDELVSATELAQVKSRAKANLVRELNSAQGLAFQLGIYQATTGDWRNLFRDVDRLDAVTPQDLQRVAKEYLRPENRTVGLIVNDPSEL